MEKIYLKKTENNWHSEKVNLESYFGSYSEEYCKIMPRQNMSVHTIFEAVIDDDSIKDKKRIKQSLREIREIGKKFKTTLPDIETLERKAKALTIRESVVKSKNSDLKDKQASKILQSREQVDNKLQISNKDDKDKPRQENESQQKHLGLRKKIDYSNKIVKGEKNDSNFEFQENGDENISQGISNQYDLQEQESDFNQKCVKEKINEIYNSNVKNPPLSKTSLNRLKMKQWSKNKNMLCKKNIFTNRGQLFQDKEINKNGKKDLQRGKTFLVSFRVHEPFDQRGRGKVGNFQQEIIVLANQSLLELRDKIICQADFQDVQGDISHKPESLVTDLSRDKYKSAMFYLDNTFYIDERGERDYSEVIREWALSRGINVGPTQNMGSMMVGKLEIRFGYPYVFIHQGSCEHLIVISDARLLSGRYSLDSNNYPLISRIPRTQTRYCFTCLKRPVKWLVFGCENLPLDIAFLCPKCFKSFNYVNGEKIGNFKAYRYFQKSLLF